MTSLAMSVGMLQSRGGVSGLEKRPNSLRLPMTIGPHDGLDQ